VTEIVVGDARVVLGDCRDVLRTLADNSVDSVVTDPPYEIGFMGRSWDGTGVAYDVTVWEECLRVLKPGGHILAFGGSRTFHRLAVAVEDAGFEIRDTIAWISSKTFPKSLNVEKAMDKAGMDGSVAAGWGTGLKQVVEPVVLGRKPLIGTVAENFLAWGVGGLNIDASRIGTEKVTINTFDNGAKPFGGAVGEPFTSRQSQGRWPANVILDEVTAGLLDEQSGVLKSGEISPNHKRTAPNGNGFTMGHMMPTVPDRRAANEGGASRFFYQAKASKRDRNEGLEGLEARQVFGDDGDTYRGLSNSKNPSKNFHPTVKPTQLMRYLIKLVTPPGGTVLDPFTGSGSTGKAALLDGYKFVGAELTEEYLPIIEGRLRWALKQDADVDETLF
jgi:site-specific DNA-methyltransferase (adenine-specific)